MPKYGFCAFCLHDANGDAHGHVGQCAYNSRPNVMANHADFVEGQNRRRERMVREYLATLGDDAIRNRAIVDCAQDFTDLGINIRNNR